MKLYKTPNIRFNRIHSSSVITTSDPQIRDDEADPNNPALSPQRGSDWENW